MASKNLIRSRVCLRRKLSWPTSGAPGRARGSSRIPGGHGVSIRETCRSPAVTSKGAPHYRRRSPSRCGVPERLGETPHEAESPTDARNPTSENFGHFSFPSSSERVLITGNDFRRPPHSPAHLFPARTKKRRRNGERKPGVVVWSGGNFGNVDGINKSGGGVTGTCLRLTCCGILAEAAKEVQKRKQKTSLKFRDM